MGGNMAFYFAVKHSELFGSLISYAGTYHHLYHKGSHTVGVAQEKAIELYEDMMREKRYLDCYDKLLNLLQKRLKLGIYIYNLLD